MARKKAARKSVASFEEMMKKSRGYKKLSEETKKIIREMSECQDQGGPVGSAPLEES